MPAIGEASYILVNTQNNIDPVHGPSHDLYYEGTQAGINTVVAIYGGVSGVRIRSNKPGEHASVVISIPYAEGDTGPVGTTLVFDFQANRIQKDLLDSTLGQTLTQTEKEQIRNALNNPGTGTVPTGATALKLYKWMLAGVTHSIVYQPTLRMMTTAAPGWVFASSFAGDGQIWTTAQVLAFTGTLPFPLPASSTVDSDGFIFGWLKHVPAYNLTVGERMTEIIEWEYGKWPLELYTAF